MPQQAKGATFRKVTGRMSFCATLKKAIFIAVSVSPVVQSIEQKHPLWHMQGSANWTRNITFSNT